jgi:hypothetical protein
MPGAFRIEGDLPYIRVETRHDHRPPFLPQCAAPDTMSVAAGFQQAQAELYHACPGRKAGSRSKWGTQYERFAHYKLFIFQPFGVAIPLWESMLPIK